ncbi:MAG: poly-gamma-glutamate hydrolase family protein [Desertimonas sp.]
MTHHRYFAYGSNLWGPQMAERCPGATRPTPAVLDGHAWLINERGVATIEPVAGHVVHGVVWEVTDGDLAALDGFEGVPDRYRRVVRSVTTTAGVVDAVVYIDPRIEPGPPRPGYLERVIDGAVEQRLPDDWVDQLRAWDRARWAAFEQTPRVQPGGPSTLRELLAAPGVTESVELRSRFGFLAIHGGWLEVGTDVIASGAAARSGASFYGVWHPDEHRHHLASTRYDPAESPPLRSFLDHVDVVVSVHGYGRRGRWMELLAGGTNRVLADHVAGHLRAGLSGYEVVTDLDAIPAALRGLHRDNPVNRPRGGGVQLELPPRVRGNSPRSPKPGADGVSPVVHDLIAALAAAARAWPAHPTGG